MSSDQGNLSKGIDNKTVRRQGCRGLYPLFTYVLLPVIRVYKETKLLEIVIFFYIFYIYDFIIAQSFYIVKYA